MNDMPMWRPPVDRPLDSDPTIQLVLNQWRRRKPVQPVFVAAVLGVLMFVIHRGFSMLGVVFLALAATALVGVLQFRGRVAWWLPSAPSLLEGAVAVRVRSEAVGGAGARTLLSIDGGRLCLHVTNTEANARQLLVRQREVSLVGPNADGVAAVVVDGLPVPLPARVVPAPASASPVAVTDEDLPRQAAAKAVRVTWLGVAVIALLGASVLFDVLLIFEGLLPASAGFVVVVAAGLIAGFFRRGDQRHMVKLLDNGPWQAYPAQLLSWGGNPALVGRLRLALTLPDGSRLPVTTRLGPAWLVADVTAPGYLWVAGVPRYGAAGVVGLPGYPHVAAVRFEEAQAR